MTTGKRFESKAAEVASATPVEEIRWRIDAAEKTESYGAASWWRRVLEESKPSRKRGKA